MNTLQFVQPNTMVYDVDSSSYVFVHAKDPVPLTNYFLHFKYINSLQETNNNGQSGHLFTEVNDHKPAAKVPISFKYADAVLLMLIALFALIAYVKISGKNYLNRIITSVGNYSYSNSFFKEKNLAYTLNNNILNFIFFISAAMMIKLLIDSFDFPMPIPGKWAQLLIYLISIVSLVVVYKFVYRLLGLFIGNYRIAAEFLFFFSNLLKMLGIVYVIILFGSHFTHGAVKQAFLYTTILATLIVYFIKVYRILVIFLKNRFPLYYMILYFCALEIIPVVLIIKILWLLGHENYAIFNVLV